MICLDTNYLILGLVKDSRESKQLMAWIEAKETLVAPMPVWYEFLCGPVTKMQITAMRAFLAEIISFDQKHAAKSAELFETTGQKRKLKIDAMIAATAILSDVPLATNNRKDFRQFSKAGLQLIAP